jgi:hypothetical protein
VRPPTPGGATPLQVAIRLTNENRGPAEVFLLGPAAAQDDSGTAYRPGQADGLWTCPASSLAGCMREIEAARANPTILGPGESVAVMLSFRVTGRPVAEAVSVTTSFAMRLPGTGPGDTGFTRHAASLTNLPIDRR